MSPRYDHEWVGSLLATDRRLDSMAAVEFLHASGLGPGMTVVDYGCGPGFLTLPAAEIVGSEGRVIALDIEQKMVSLVARRAAEAGYLNVEAVLNSGPQAPLDESIADLALCVLVFHYRDGREQRLSLARDLSRLLKPEGRAVIVQWTGQVSFEETAELLSQCDLDADGPHPAGENRYRLVATTASARRPPSARPSTVSDLPSP